jgi:membrane protease YdiL (CAAX protease family)
MQTTASPESLRSSMAAGPPSRIGSRLLLAGAVILAFVVINEIRSLLGQLDSFTALYDQYPREVPTMIWKAIQLPLTLIAIGLLYRVGLRGALRELGLAAPVARGLAVAFAISLPALLIFALFGRLNPELTAAHLLMTGLASPLSEEILFRGFLFRQLYERARWPFWTAVLANALPFAWGHLYQASQAGYGLTRGLMLLSVMSLVAGFLAWLFVRWGYNLWVPIGLHSFLNAGAYLFSAGENAVASPTMIGAVLLTMAVALGLTLRYTPAGKPDSQLLYRRA